MSKQFKVTLNDKVVLVNAGTTLSNILDIEKPCGGNGVCGKCKVLVDDNEELACKYKINSNITVTTFKQFEIVSETGIEESNSYTSNICYVLDIGTTTLALALVSLDDKRTIKVTTATNPQRKFGADVITRIDYCRKNGVTELQYVLISKINEMIKEIGATANTMYVSANTTMLHTFFGVDCSSIGVAPYKPVFLESKRKNANLLGLKGVDTVISLPGISSFVGSDVVAGLNLLNSPENGKYNLFIDLGTNAEIVLYSNKSGLATSAASGPCFEGANITCGMSATKGATYAFKINDGNAEYKTIGNEKTLGICGTGLIDIIAELVKYGVIDETGYMEDNYQISKTVYLSPDDVRQYQLAKSAVYSATLTLMKTLDVNFNDVSNLYISGGFSSKINIANAIITGLLPKELALKTKTLNNSSLQGAVKYLLEGGNINRFVDNIKYVDLSSNPYFCDLFMENMTF